MRRTFWQEIGENLFVNIEFYFALMMRCKEKKERKSLIIIKKEEENKNGRKERDKEIFIEK